MKVYLQSSFPLTKSVEKDFTTVYGSSPPPRECASFTTGNVQHTGASVTIANCLKQGNEMCNVFVKLGIQCTLYSDVCFTYTKLYVVGFLFTTVPTVLPRAVRVFLSARKAKIPTIDQCAAGPGHLVTKDSDSEGVVPFSSEC